MKINRFCRVFILLLLVGISGCQHIKEQKETYVRNRAKDYLKSGITAPLQVPEGLSMPPINDDYPIPADLPEPGTLKRVSLAPPGFGTDISTQ